MNADESWLDMSDYRRMKWQKKGTKCSLAKSSINPRISLTVAVDTEGNVYYAVSQGNNNSQTTSLLFKQLCALLDKTKKNWRKSHVFTLDNAPYHTSTETMKMLEQLKVPLLMLAPYSYDVAPCELFFSLFKSSDINPDRLATGKK